MRYAIFGSGGFGRELAPLAREAAETVSPAQESPRLIPSIVFVSDDIEEVGTTKNGILVISFDDLANNYRDHNLILAVGDPATRKRIADRCSMAGLSFGKLYAKTARFLDNVIIGEGSVFCDFSMATSNIQIGRHFHANLYSYVAHDCVVGDYVTLAPRVCINGNTIIEDGVYIGTGAVLKQGTSDKPLRIGKGAVIGMGAVVTKDVEAGTTVVGNPARPR